MDGRLVSLGSLFGGDRVFDIPVFQRSYAWEDKNLQDLWEDLEYLDDSKRHYFGTVLLKDSGKVAETDFETLKRFDVIDGQQRLTTISILLGEIISQLEADNIGSEGSLVNLREKYLRYNSYYRLNPPGSEPGGDGNFFHRYVVDDDYDESEAGTHSQRRIVAARKFFRKRISKRLFPNMTASKYRVELSESQERRLNEVANRGRSAARTVKRALALLKTDEGQTDDRIAEAVSKSRRTVVRIRKRFCEEGLDTHLSAALVSQCLGPCI